MKRNVREKWVKYIINKNIKKSRQSSYHLQRGLPQGPKHFVLYLFLYEIYGFYHTTKDIFELSLQAGLTRLKSRNFFFLFLKLLLYRYVHVVSSFFVFNFSFYTQKKSSFKQKCFFFKVCSKYESPKCVLNNLNLYLIVFLESLKLLLLLKNVIPSAIYNLNSLILPANRETNSQILQHRPLHYTYYCLQ